MSVLELILDHDRRIEREYGVSPTLRYVSADVLWEMQSLVPPQFKFITPYTGNDIYICGIKVIVKPNFKGLLIMTPREFIPEL